MRILLVSPIKLSSLKESKGTIPVPLLHLGAILREEGHEVTVYDFSIFKCSSGQFEDNPIKKEIDNLISKLQPNLVGINCFTTLHFPFTQLISEYIKTINNDIKIVIGGSHPSLFSEEILENDKNIDFIVLGEGETQLIALANSYYAGKFENLNNIPAFAYRDVNGGIVKNKRRGFIDDLSLLPMPAWDLINIKHYYADLSSWYNPKGHKFELCMPILSSRSCPFSCNFCACYATMGRGFRARSPERVVDEIQFLNEKYNQQYFGFIDDNINLDPKHIIEICDEIVKRNLDIQFETTCGVHIASLTEEVVNAMSDAGCVFVRLPIEHGSDYIRNDIIGKKLSREKIYSAVENLRKKEILTSSMFIMGFPEETGDTLEETYNLIHELKVDLNYVFNLIPFPGTRVFQQAMKDGLLTEKYNINDLWKGAIDLDPVQDECHFFIKPYKMSIEELMEFRVRFDKLQFFSKDAKRLNKIE